MKNDRHLIYFDDYMGAPVSYRCQMGEPFPASFDPTGYETHEEAEKARLEMESYLMRNVPSNLNKKKGKK